MTVHLASLSAQREPDELLYTLDSVEISASVNRSPVRESRGGQLNLDMEFLEGLPKFLGNTDPVSITRMLPGIQMAGEYDGRLNIDGGANGHNQLSLDGVPLYNTCHLLGFFSTFIPSHYRSMSLRKTPGTAQSPNRIGGQLEFLPDMETGQDKTDGEFSVGLISSQGTVNIPTGKKSRLILSLRDSYINMLYSPWLSSDDARMDYSFYDSNVTWTFNPNQRNNITADFYWGKDNVRLYRDDYMADIKFNWGNNAQALHWTHRLSGHELTLKQTVYRTRYGNEFEIHHDNISMSMPTGITDLGYKFIATGKNTALGLDAISHSITLQEPVISGTYNLSGHNTGNKRSREYSLFIDQTIPVTDGLDISLGLRGNLFVIDGSTYPSADPSLTISYSNETDGWDLSLNLTQRHQFLFQTGVTDYGLPIEFWLSADKRNAPQYMQGITLSGNTPLFNGDYSLSASIYCRRLFNQLEYYGTLIDFLATDYSVYDHLIDGKGYNYGADLLVTKNTGKISGWISYSYGRALRTFSSPDMEGIYPASHERIHELDLLLSYKTGKRWEPSCIFVAAGGTPFTAPSYFYIMNQQIVTRYGDYNAHRLRPYIRMDISVNYDLKHKSGSFITKHGLSLSLYNVLCRNNDISYQMKIHHDRLYYHHVTFVTNILPSISYYCRF